MKYLIMIPLVLFALCLQSFETYTSSSAFPIFDTEIFQGLPRNFRTTERFANPQPSHINFTGLDQLNASGSGQFSEESFKEMMNHLLPSNRIIVVDLREESHGFVNGAPVSWTDGLDNAVNRGKMKFEIEHDEKTRLELAWIERGLMINEKVAEAKIRHDVAEAKTERALVEEFGQIYLRMPVTDHCPPSDEIVDQFVHLMSQLPPNQRVHFHCKAGKGRTTTFMTLLDILKNSHQVSLEDILYRQESIGGANLYNKNKSNDYKMLRAKERLDFIKRFYLYTKEVPNYNLSWSDWLKQQ